MIHDRPREQRHARDLDERPQRGESPDSARAERPVDEDDADDAQQPEQVDAALEAQAADLDRAGSTIGRARPARSRARRDADRRPRTAPAARR